MLRKEGSSLVDTPLIDQLLDTGGRYSLPSYTAPPYTDILEIPTRHFAQQITAMDNVSQLFTGFVNVYSFFVPHLPLLH
jgi:hypothetical protein